MLKAQVEKFCQEYVVCNVGAEAAVKAGYSSRTAKVQASRLLTNANVQQRIKDLQADMRERNKLTEDLVVNELRKLSFWDVRTFINEDNTIKKLSELSADQVTPVTGIKVKETVTKTGDVTVKEITTELKLSDKRAGLVDLGKYLGIFEKDNDQRKPVVKIRVTNKK